jgi:hypothetical protein
LYPLIVGNALTDPIQFRPRPKCPIDLFTADTPDPQVIGAMALWLSPIVTTALGLTTGQILLVKRTRTHW